MKGIKQKLLIMIVAVLGALCGIIYWNSHLYSHSQRMFDEEKKIDLLKRANRFFPFNDMVSYEIGKSYLDLGIQNLNDKERTILYLNKSTAYLDRSIRLNPFSNYSHFYKAQALQYLKYTAPSYQDPFYEYQKASMLAGYNSEIYFEIGKTLFSHWPELSQEKRDYILIMLQEIAQHTDKFRALLHIWKINGIDYEVMRKILPESISAYQVYANFLGQESLSLDERKQILSKLDRFRYDRSRRSYESGERALYYYQIPEAKQHFQECLSTLESIRYYKAIIQDEQADSFIVENLRKNTYLNLAKCIIEESQDLKPAKEFLLRYLEMEEHVPAVNELATYLSSRGMIYRTETNFEDLDRIALQVYIYFKQNRYRDIAKIGREVQRKAALISKNNSEAYIKILQITGDALQKIDYIYEATEFYQEALEKDNNNLNTLMRLLKNFERLNYGEEIQVLKKQIKDALSKEIILVNFNLQKGRNMRKSVVLDGNEFVLNFKFGKRLQEADPLVSIFFNRRNIYEDYLITDSLSFRLKSKVGPNQIRITAVNHPVVISQISYKLD